MPTEDMFNLDTLKKAYESVFESTFVIPYSDERHVWKIPELLMNHMDWKTIYLQDSKRAKQYVNETGKSYDEAIRDLVYQEDGYDVLRRLVNQEGLINGLVDSIKAARDSGSQFKNITDTSIENEVRETLPDMVELINTKEVLKNIDHFVTMRKEQNMEQLEKNGFSLEALKGAYEQILKDHGGINYPYYLLPEMPWEQVYNESREAFLNELQSEPAFTFDDFAELMIQAGAEQLVDQYIDTEKQQQIAVSVMKKYVDFDSRYEDVTEDALKAYFADSFNNTVEAFADPFGVLDSIQAEQMDKEAEEQEDFMINPAAKDQPLATGMGTDKHLFDTYEEAYINTGQASLFQAPEELFDRNGNMYNDEIDIDEIVDEMQAYAETELTRYNTEVIIKNKETGEIENISAYDETTWQGGDLTNWEFVASSYPFDDQIVKDALAEPEIIDYQSAIYTVFQTGMKELGLTPDQVSEIYLNHLRYEFLAGYTREQLLEMLEHNKKSDIEPKVVAPTQKQTKALKREIVEEGALQIGYLQGVKAKMLELDPDIIEKTVASSGGWVGESLTLQADEVPQRGEFDNILVTEMVRNLNYQDFKEVAPYFFQYSSMLAENGHTEIIGQDIDMAEATLQRHIEDGALDNGVRFELPKTSLADVEDGYDIVAYNPIEQRSVTIDLAKDGKQFELSLANQFGDKMGQPLLVTEEAFNNPIIASDKVHDLFVLNGIEKQTASRFASMEVIDRLEESGISFSKTDLDEALKEPKQLQSVEKLIEKNQVSEQVTVQGPRR